MYLLKRTTDLLPTTRPSVSLSGAVCSEITLPLDTVSKMMYNIILHYSLIELSDLIAQCIANTQIYVYNLLKLNIILEC